MEQKLEVLYLDNEPTTFYCCPRERVLAKLHTKVHVLEQDIFRLEIAISQQPAQDVESMEVVTDKEEQIRLLRNVIKVVTAIEERPILNTYLQDSTDCIRSELEYLLKGEYNTPKSVEYYNSCRDVLRMFFMDK